MYKAILFTLQKVRRSNKLVFYSFIFFSIISSTLTFGTTLIFREIVDTVNNADTVLHLSIIGVLVFKLGFDIFAGLINSIRMSLLPLVKKNTSIFLLNELIDKTSQLDVASLEDPKTVGIISRAYNRIDFEIEHYFRSIIQLLTSAIEIILPLVTFYLISPIGTFILLVTNLISALVDVKLGGSNFIIYRANDQTRLKFSYSADLLQKRDTLLELKLFQNFNYIKRRIINIFNTFITKEINHQKRNNIISSIVRLIPIFGSFLFTLIIANQLQNQQITVGTFVFLFTNMIVFASALFRFNTTLTNVSLNSNLVKDLMEFYELEPKIKDVTLSKSEYKLLSEKLQKPNITIENVSFKYPHSNNFALKNVSLTIPYSQNLALIGENGAGKTTLIKLLLRVYDPTEGKIMINGIDLKQIPFKLLYKNFGTLFQNFGKFNLTVKENLELASNEKLSEEGMIKNLKYANAWEFVQSLKNGLNQQLGPEFKDGVDLSVGQWQRLAIARAYSKKAPIIILDEPTSAIDVKSEMEIFDKLNTKMESETLIFISHRFTTIKDAERIVVLDKGKVIEDGVHSELMKNNGKYAQLYNIQAERIRRE